MIVYPLDVEMLTIEDFKFDVGDLVTTILGEYGVVVRIGRHAEYHTDRTTYYHVLINGYIYCYLAFALIKIKKSEKNT